MGIMGVLHVKDPFIRSIYKIHVSILEKNTVNKSKRNDKRPTRVGSWWKNAQINIHSIYTYIYIYIYVYNTCVCVSS